jgi:hypothetical protein
VWAPRLHLHVCSQHVVEAVQQLLKVLHVYNMPRDMRLLIVQNFVTPGLPIKRGEVA